MSDKTAKETKPKKKIVAREYLIFLTCFAIGAIILPMVGSIPYYKVVSGLFGGRNFVEAWIFVLLPYIFISLIRSIIWALRTFFYK